MPDDIPREPQNVAKAVTLLVKSGLFNTDYYLTRYPEVMFQGDRPVLHYLTTGAAKNFNPSPTFDTRAYRDQYQNGRAARMNPLVHYLVFGRQKGITPPPVSDEEDDPRRHPHWRDYFAVKNKLDQPAQAGAVDTGDLRLIALYLPQFHPIPENDQWWGEGFTEWTNLRKAEKHFPGHRQPRQPGALGHYDLRDAQVMEQQAALARQYGIHGFCYHYYWFNGHRLLEMPIERMLTTGKPDMPFCLCWANENWTRRWDGKENEVLMPQDHTPQDDEAVIRDLARFFEDERYIRIAGKPVLIIYRIDLFPDIRKSAERWRQVCRDIGIGEIYLVFAETFGLWSDEVTPQSIGFDAAMEYPPHNSPPEFSGRLPPEFADFEGMLFDYHNVALHRMQRQLPDWPLIRAVMPGWDNTPRRGKHGHVYFGASPGGYQAWLETIVRQTAANKAKEEQIVFINAWNEWAESAYLEPDEDYGYDYLDATQNALEGEEPGSV